MPSLATETRFIQLAKLIDSHIDDGVVFSVAASLQPRYSEPQRHYHTLEHVSHMLAGLDVQPDLQNSKIIELAIWFHDCVYDPVKGSPWNERESIRVWEEFADSTQSQALSCLKNSVTALIEATISHRLPKELPGPLTASDAAAFLDLDMAILADPPEAYEKYAQDIRKEYSHFPSDVYRTGRSKVLESFLSRERYIWEVARRQWKREQERTVYNKSEDARSQFFMFKLLIIYLWSPHIG
ncbi:hypothetical protein B0H10DRAFT_2434086 [Mycena sp. CBHHK59/15]|nr:hypothetical protein B0H10DRAFT_2434086 [Mycena sp. CBHHK59/15]